MTIENSRVVMATLYFHNQKSNTCDTVLAS